MTLRRGVLVACLIAFVGSGVFGFADWNKITGSDEAMPRVVGLGSASLPGLHYRHPEVESRTEPGPSESAPPAEAPASTAEGNSVEPPTESPPEPEAEGELEAPRPSGEGHAGSHSKPPAWEEEEEAQ